MIFPTVEFAMFFVVVLTVSWLLMPQPRLWKPFIVAASYYFYAYAGVHFVFLIMASTAINWVAGEVIARSPDPRVRRGALWAAVAGGLGLLAYFKYYGFFVVNVARVLDSIGLGSPLPLLQIALPVGISFFTFMGMSYVIDIYRGGLEPASFVDFAVFLCFFPHLVAGPIVRASEFIPQLATPRDPRAIPATRAFFLIGGGLIKKVIIADVLATRLVDPVFATPGNHSALETLIAIYGYAVQIFCDFSAYSEIAIGIALLLGFRFPDNFDRPYTAVSLQDFWRRWHMSLSRWLRDYLYVSLGGNRGGRAKTYRNLMLTMVIGGLWHGAAWTFVLWGTLHGTGLAVERYWAQRRGGPRLGKPAPPSIAVPGGGAGVIGPAAGPGQTTLVAEAVEAPAHSADVVDVVDVAPRRFPVWARRLVTFHVVCLAWVFFRSPDLTTAFTILGRLLTFTAAAPLVSVAVLLAIIGGIAAQYVPATAWEPLQAAFSGQRVWVHVVGIGVFIVLVNAALGNQTVPPFIYFRF